MEKMNNRTFYFLTFGIIIPMILYLILVSNSACDRFKKAFPTKVSAVVIEFKSFFKDWTVETEDYSIQNFKCYDKSGNLLGGDSVVEHDSHGRLTKRVSYADYKSRCQVDLYKYDSLGRVLDVVSYLTVDNDTNISNCRYGILGHIDYIANYSNQLINWDVSIFNFSRLKIMITNDIFDKKAVYKLFDKNNNLIREVILSEKFPAEYIKYKYNKASKLIEENHFDSGFVMTYKKFYKYNKKNKLIEDSSICYFDDFTSSERTTFMYDDKSNLIEKRIYQSGELSYMYVYNYNENRQKTLSLLYHRNWYSIFFGISGNTYKYDEQNNLIEQVKFVSIGMPLYKTNYKIIYITKRIHLNMEKEQWEFLNENESLL